MFLSFFSGRTLMVELVINHLAHPPSGNVTDETTSADPRILILSVSPDLSASYIPVMNSIFSAQKLVRVVQHDDITKRLNTVWLLESYHRRLQSFRGGNGIPPASGALNRGILYTSRTTGCFPAVPHGTFFGLTTELG
jgi:hypothetical protein